MIVIGSSLFVYVLFLLPYSGVQLVTLLHINDVLVTPFHFALIKWSLEILTGIHAVCQPLCYFRMVEFRRLACSSRKSEQRRLGCSNSPSILQSNYARTIILLQLAEAPWHLRFSYLCFRCEGLSQDKHMATKPLRCDKILTELPLIRELLSAICDKDDNEEVGKCIEKLCEALHKKGLEIDTVMDELELWLCYFTGQPLSDKSADRCLSFFVKCGLKMILENTVMPPLLTLLLRHIENIQYAIYDTSRYRCCRLITLIFEAVEDIEADYEPTRCREEGILPAEVMENLIKILHERIYDKNPFVRAEVIRSFSVLYRINNADENGLDCTKYIINALMDISRDVRAEAVRSIPLFSENNIATFISAVLVENDNSICRLAYSRIACSLHVRSLTVQQRMQLLKTAFTKDDAVLRKIIERMVVNWAGNDSVPLLNLLQHLDFISDSQTTQQALMTFLKNYQKEIGSARTSEMLINLSKLCSAAQSKMDTAGTASYTDFVKYDILDRRNFAELHCSSKNNLYVVAGRVYIWRSLCEYCKLNAVDEGDRYEALHFLLPDMIHFVDFLYNSLVTWTASTSSVQGLLEEFVIFQLCLLTRLFDQKDQVGMEKWRSTLETIISTRNLPNSEQVLEFSVCELFDLFYAKEGKSEEFLEWCCYRLNSFFTPDLNETEELPLTRALLVKRGTDCAMLAGKTIEDDNEFEPNNHNLQRALLFLRAIMRNSCTAKVTTFLRAAFDQVVDTYCSTLDPMIWVSLSEVIGIGVAIDEQIARERIHMLRSAIEVEGAPTRVKVPARKLILPYNFSFEGDLGGLNEIQAIALMSIAACAIRRSYAKTAQLYYPEVVGCGVVKGKMLLQVFEGFIFSQDAELSFTAVENIGKILYHGCFCFPSALAGLLLRYFDNSCHPHPYAFLNYFFSFYPASSSINQHKLVGALRCALKRLNAAADGDELLLFVDANKMVNFVAKAVRKATLSDSAKKKEMEQTYPPQFFLISFLLDWVVNNAEDNLSAVCIGALTYTSPEEFSHNNKAYSYLLKLTKRCINVLFAHELDKLIPITRRFGRRLQHGKKRCGYVDNRKSNQSFNQLSHEH
uniref:Nuclear condensin complex subunit 3 C-terminal domain-containing protein n=1 Tax=Setaria digitata TaxID=48799 RepID=A0A915PUR9_9BILA